MSFIEWINNIGAAWWSAIIAALVGICTGLGFIGKWLIKKYSCPVSATIRSLYAYEFDQGQKYVFGLLIQNCKNYPITLSKIEYIINKTAFTDLRNNDPISLSDQSSLNIIREYLLPLNARNSTKHKFVFHIGKKKYTIRLFAQIQN